jgi:hypothetical protein
MQRLAATLPLLLALAGCAPTVGPEPSGVPAPARVEPRRADASSANYAPGRYRYEVRVDGTAQAGGGPTVHRGTARLRSASFFTVEVLRQSQISAPRIRVTPDSHMVQGTEPRIPAPDANVAPGADYEVALSIDGRSSRITPAGLGCPGRSPLEGAMRDLVVPLPAELRVGTRWADTVVTVTCRDGVPITAVTTVEYRVTGTEQRAGVRMHRLRRTSSSRLDGSTVRGGQAVGVSGTSTDDGTLLIDPARGIIVAAEQRVDASLSLTGREGDIPLRQRYTVLVRLLDQVP